MREAGSNGASMRAVAVAAGLTVLCAGCAGSDDRPVVVPIPTVPATTSPAAARDPAAAWPRTMHWTGTVSGRAVQLLMTRDGARLRLRSTSGAPLELGGMIEGMTVRLRAVAPDGAQSAELIATFEPADAHRELATLWASSEFSLVEDLGAAAGANVTWRALKVDEPFVSIDVTWPELGGAGHAAVDAWLAGTGTAYEDDVRTAATALLAEARAAGVRVEDTPSDAGASLYASSHLVRLDERFVSAHEEHSVWLGQGAHPFNGMACATFDRSSGKPLRIADVFAGDARAAVTTALEGMKLEVDLDDDQIAFATRPEAQVCLVRHGVWLEFALPHVVVAMDGIAVPYDRLGPALRPGIAPR